MSSKNNKLVFIGTIKKVANCGESMKNHLFIERFREVFDKVITVDVWAPKKHPWNILKMVLVAITHRNTPVVMSVSISTGDKILHWLQKLGCKNIYYWAVGGTMHLRLEEPQFDPEPYKKLKAIYVQSPQIVEGLKKFGINNAIHVNDWMPACQAGCLSVRRRCRRWPSLRCRCGFHTLVRQANRCGCGVLSARW